MWATVDVMNVINRFNQENNHRAKTHSITFRIEAKYFDKLQQEANSRGISVNSLINHIIKDYFEWFIFQPKVGFVPVLKPVLREVFNKMSKEQINEVANSGKEEVTNALHFMTGKLDLDCFLAWFEERMKNSSIQVSHTLDNNSRMHTYVVKHDMCENWSIYLKEITKHIFNEIFKTNVQLIASDTTLTFKFKQD